MDPERSLMIVGGQWGDEGKGKVVDLLSARYPVVIRYNGGHNAGHTVRFADRRFALHLVPSGVIHEGVTCYLAAGMVIDPSFLVTEIDRLNTEGIATEGRVFVSPRASLILPTNQALDGVREQARGSGKGAEIVVPPTPQLTRAQKLEKLTKFMCKVSGIRWDPKEDVERALNLRKQWIFDFESPFMNDLREQCDDMKYWSRIYEIHLLAEAIVDNTKTDEEFYKLVGLLWQETQFINRRGKHNERSFYQFLPATVKWWKGVDNIGLVNVLYEVENDPGKATNLALEMLRKNNWNWNWRNHSINYEYQLNNKIYQFKQEWRK